LDKAITIVVIDFSRGRKEEVMGMDDDWTWWLLAAWDLLAYWSVHTT